MWQEIFRNIMETSRWRVIGAGVGLFVGILFILLGFFRAVFLLVLAFISATGWTK